MGELRVVATSDPIPNDVVAVRPDFSAANYQAVRNALGSTKNLEGLNGMYTYDGSGDNVRQEPRLLVYGPTGFDAAK